LISRDNHDEESFSGRDCRTPVRFCGRRQTAPRRSGSREGGIDDGDVVGFSFLSLPLGLGKIEAGQNSVLLVVQTNARQFVTTNAAVIDGSWTPPPVQKVS
jgi:hypothetical protein